MRCGRFARGNRLGILSYLTQPRGLEKTHNLSFLHHQVRPPQKYLQNSIPVFVPCFNNPTYVRNTVTQLRNIGLKHITLIDDGSTYPPMLDLLSELSSSVEVLRNESPGGARYIIHDEQCFGLLPERFCITDPDLAFNPRVPEDFLTQLFALTEKYRIGKAGFAIDISERERLRSDDFLIAGRNWKIWEWESRFWEKPLEPLSSGDPVYEAGIDTTFAVYNKQFFDPNDLHRAVRVAGNYTCQHLPWYKESIVPKEETSYYNGSSVKFGNYHRQSPEYSLALLLELYKDREDLQKVFPEVVHDDYSRLIDWAYRVSAGEWEDFSYQRLMPYSSWFRQLRDNEQPKSNARVSS